MQTSVVISSQQFRPKRLQRQQSYSKPIKILHRSIISASAVPKNNSSQSNKKNNNNKSEIQNIEDIDYLLPEEDYTVPGGYEDSLSSNTPLGQAIRGACDELDTLGSIQKDVLKESSDLLKKLGYKGDIFKQKNPEDQTELEKQLSEEET